MAEQNWLKISVKVSRETEEMISALLVTAGADGVEIEDTQDYLSAATDFGDVMPEIEQADTIVISAYFPEATVTPEFLITLREKVAECGDFELTTDRLAEADWANAWKQYFQPVRISRQLTIVPSWANYQATSENEKLIFLDPGMTFGTGTHPTTKISLWALEMVLRGGETVLDVGTGSGVLAIAGALLGAKEIYAYDLDATAVRVAKENIALNSTTTAKIHVAAGDLLKNVTQDAEVIVANILADVLLLMIDDAFKLVKDSGTLILSGIISGKRECVLNKAIEAGFQLDTAMQQGEWHCLVLKKQKEELFFG
ncbi:MAG: 50S ribosomal protein L11 methyltransferase [Streptococcaceae bacterium]|jgi:ribosomal protein L11 methyltransferase|nr:50S ribosomal protein L11 methyltransferase [Streptococcaceae bacterium]